MGFIDVIKDRARANVKTIVLPETEDKRTLEAADKILKEGLAKLIEDSGASLVGAGIVIEKGFQVGGDLIRSRGIHLESLAIVESMDEKTGEIVFRD